MYLNISDKALVNGLTTFLNHCIGYIKLQVTMATMFIVSLFSLVVKTNRPTGQTKYQINFNKMDDLKKDCILVSCHGRVDNNGWMDGTDR